MILWKKPLAVLATVLTVSLIATFSQAQTSNTADSSKPEFAWPHQDFRIVKDVSRASGTSGSDPVTAGEVTLQALPDDPQFIQQWPLNNTGQQGGVVDADIDAVEAWDITRGSRDVVVGVLDAGVDYTHPDLAANIWTNPGEIADNGVDDDNNGYVDDVHGMGNILEHVYSRGTAVNGVIGAVGNNGIGISGVAPNVSMVNCRVVDEYFEDEFDEGYVEACIDYFLTLKSQGVNLKVINVSWGWNSSTTSLQDKFDELEAAGILVVATAGWSGVNNDESPHWPSGFPNDNILAVTATDRFDRSEVYSYGPTSVDMAAPAESIYSTALRGTYQISDSYYLFGAAHVTGAAALLWAAYPDLSALQVKDILMSSGDPLDDLAGRTVSGKRLNVRRALESVDMSPNFEVQAQETTHTILAGESASFRFDVTALNGFSSLVRFSVETELPGVTLSRQQVPGSGQTLMQLTTDQSLAWGDYEITLVATSGQLRKTATVLLSVLPSSFTTISYENTNDVEIYEESLFHSDIWVDNQQTAFEVRIHATFKDSLMDWYKLILESPSGTQVVQQIPTQSGYVNDTFTYTFNNFYGEPAAGNWRLYIDTSIFDIGTLDAWALEIQVAGEARSSFPSASFWYEPVQEGMKFYNTSTDPDGDIVSWLWDFGDGATSSRPSPLHVYAVDGYYNVKLTVTDSEGNTSTENQPFVLASAPILNAWGSGNITRNNVMINRIRWNGSYRKMVDIFRNGRKIATTPNDRIFVDRMPGVTGGRYVYRVCDRRPVCSERFTIDL